LTQRERLRLPDAIVLAKAHWLDGDLLACDDRLNSLARKRGRKRM